MPRRNVNIYPQGFLSLAGAALLASIAAPLPAAECIGVSLPDRMQAPDRQPLVLNGMGVRKATLFKVKVYVAGLYLPESSSDAVGSPGSGMRSGTRSRVGRIGRLSPSR